MSHLNVCWNSSVRLGPTRDQLQTSSLLQMEFDIPRRDEEGAQAREFMKRFFESRPDAPIPKMIVTDSAGRRELTREETSGHAAGIEVASPGRLACTS
jgi:hypothetical protein